MPRPKRPELTREQKIAHVKKLQQQRKEQAEREEQELLRRSKKMRGPLGLIIKIIAVVNIVGAVCLIVDNELDPVYQQMPIQDHYEEVVQIVDRSGYAYPAIFEHVFFGETGGMELDVHQGTIQESIDTGFVTVGFTPVFGELVSFTNPSGTVAYGLEVSSFWNLTLPILIMLFSILTLLLNPKWNIQTLYWSYFSVVLMPLLLLTLAGYTYVNSLETGKFEMNLNDTNAVHNILETKD